MALLKAQKLVMDYNITCPDYRFCEVHHRFSSPCELWDCNACWWNHKNCTRTEEPATDNCPYVTCQDLPRPSHNHTVATVSVISAVVFAGFFFFFLRRRFRARRAAGQAEAEAEAEADSERLPLLQRCQNFFQSTPDRSQVIERFRRLIWHGERAEIAPRENLDVELGDGQPHGRGHENLPRPSAPPAYEEIERAPIVRQGRPSLGINASRSLVNQNYGSLTTRRVRDTSRDREQQRMEEIPLMHGSRPSDATTVASREENVSNAQAVPPTTRKVPLTHSQSLQ